LACSHVRTVRTVRTYHTCCHRHDLSRQCRTPGAALTTTDRRKIPFSRITNKAIDCGLEPYFMLRLLQSVTHRVSIMAETCDILVIGAGPAGIAAARSLIQSGASTIVLEARSRVGGRAHASESLGVNVPLDHGAKWIHGASSANRMVQLLSELTFDGPEDEGIEYEISLPEEAATAGSTDETAANPPPFEVSDSGESDEVDKTLVKIKNSNRKVPAAKLTKIISLQDDGLSAKEPSLETKKVAKKAFRDIIKATIDEPRKKFESEKALFKESLFQGEDPLENASLLDVLLWSQQGPNTGESEEEKRHRFTSYCRDQLVMKHQAVQSALSSFGTEREKEAFRVEVMALVNLEIYTYFESWEGAPIHEISCVAGLEGSCLSGGNVVLPFGYGGLVKRLAKPLIIGNYIRMGHKAVSIVSSGESVNVECKREDDGTIHKFCAKQCIITLPLGVLKALIQDTGDTNNSNHVKFDPPLHSTLQRSIQRLGVSVRNKVELLFPVRWWPENIGRITIACTHMKQTPTYHPFTTFIVESAASPSDSASPVPNILVCYVAGEFARETEQKKDEQIQDECMTVLRAADLCSGGSEIPDPTAIHVTRWFQDQYSQGSWTFFGKGSSLEDVKNFRLNEECQSRGLFFAGEHTCSGAVPGDDLGCVHGAWVSGELAAQAALKRLKESSHS
jgi:monoamine oxidase